MFFEAISKSLDTESEGIVPHNIVEKQVAQSYSYFRVPYRPLQQMNILQKHDLVWFIAAVLRFEGRTLYLAL